MFSKKKSKTAKTAKRPKSTPELDRARAAALRKFQAEPRPQREAPGDAHVEEHGQGVEPTTAPDEPVVESAAETNEPAAATEHVAETNESKPQRSPRKARTHKAGQTSKPEPGPKRLSALDAAAKVLAESNAPMRATDLIAEMAKQGLWTSPGGKTPEATLYAAIAREIATKGDTSRFRKAERGLFTAAQIA
jgi:hypothetical protein